MPFGSVTLIVGVNVERTPTLLQAGISSCSLIRFRDGLVQKYGGWARFFSSVLSGVPRDLHVWEDLSQIQHLLVGTTTNLDVITNGALANITPQQLLSDFAPNFTTTMGSPTVTIVDPNISNVTVNDSVFFNTPISVGGLILSGLYPIAATLGGNSYEITAAANATSSVNNGGVVPVFTTTSGGAIVAVNFPASNIAVNDVVVFNMSTTGNGITIFNNYDVPSIIDANNFNISVPVQAASSGSFPMNGGNAELLYYLAIGPPAAGTGYGVGGYGLGGYGLGASGSSQQTGTEITATDWTSGNWGEIALACPSGGGIYQWDPSGGFQNAELVATAPPFNGGMFISTSEQILVCWGTSFMQAFGVQQDPMLVGWSTVGDYTNFVPLASDQAGNFRIPIGSMIMGGTATPNQNLIWTDLDCWAMNYLGPPDVFGFNNIGAGAGAISSHAMQQLRGSVYWMGQSNFYVAGGGGVMVLPCPVWDAVFQNLNTAFKQNVRAMPNTNFSETGWLYPSASSVNGECDSYVKMNITEQNNPWDFGPVGALPRSAWTDQSILGPPISANPSGLIYQQETTMDADGQPLMYTFTTGYFFIADGEDFTFVDQIYPDFKWGFFGASQTAQVQMTFNVTNYPGDTPISYGPYLVSQSTEWISVRFRGRQMSITVSGNDLGSFVRLGRVRYRWKPMGRR